MNKSIKEIYKFGIVGVLNSGIHIATLYLLTEFFEVYYVLASFIGFIFAVTNSFLLNTIWTFEKDIREKTKKRYVKCFIILTIAAGINLTMLYTITEIFHLWYLFSQIIATGGSLLITYLGNKHWIYTA